MKKLFIVLLFIFILISCGNEPDERNAEEKKIGHWSGLDSAVLALEPIINGFHGEIFADTNITADGYYTGFEKLDWFGGMIYCEDDAAVIWRDRNGAVFRLDSRNNKEKICLYEDCRNDFEVVCRHFPGQFIYSNGYLYFTVGDVGVMYVYRYDAGTHGIEKLMEFKGVEFCNIALNGRYLYVETCNWYEPVDGKFLAEFYTRLKIDYTITRIDLWTETAVVIYSDLQALDDFDKIGELRDWRFIGSRIIMPVFWEEKIWDIEPHPARWKILGVGSSVNICTLDMRSFEELIRMEDEKVMFNFGGDLELYGGDIYFSTGERCLSRIDMLTGKREIINENIREFCIDGDFLYYVLGDRLYRVKLDYTREINFDTAVLVYTAEENYYLNSWKVYKDYVYAYLIGEDNSGYYRVKLDSQEEPYFLYR